MLKQFLCRTPLLHTARRFCSEAAHSNGQIDFDQTGDKGSHNKSSFEPNFAPNTDIRFDDPTAQLLVRHIDWISGRKQIYDYFMQFGEISNLMLPINSNSGLHYGYAFIKFKHSNSMIKCLEQQHHRIDRKELRVMLHKPSDAQKKRMEHRKQRTMHNKMRAKQILDVSDSSDDVN